MTGITLSTMPAKTTRNAAGAPFALQLDDAHGDRHGVLRVDEDQRREVIVPAAVEGQDAEDGDARHGQRQVDAAEDLPLVGAINNRRLLKIGRNLLEVLAQQEGAEGREHRGHHQRPDGVDQVQVFDAHQDVDRDDGHLTRHHHRREHHPEQRVAAAELQAREGVARQRGRHRRAQHGATGVDEAVLGHVQEGDGIEDVLIVAEIKVEMYPHRRHGEGIPQRAEGGRDHPQQGHQRQNADDNQEGHLEPVAPWPVQRVDGVPFYDGSRGCAGHWLPLPVEDPAPAEQELDSGDDQNGGEQGDGN